MKRPSKRCCVKCLTSNLQLILMLVGIAIGVGLGFGLRAADVHTNPRDVMYVGYVGKLFLNMLKVVILPLIVSSLITGLASMESQISGKIGSIAVLFYLVTTLFAVFLGIGVVLAIEPGSYGKNLTSTDSPQVTPSTTVDSFLDLLQNMFPPNILEACFASYKTSLTVPENFNSSSANTSDYYSWKFSGKMIWPENGGFNVLGVVVFSIILGISISRSGAKGKPLGAFFESMNDVVMNIVAAIMWLAPVGVCFLVCEQILKVDDFVKLIAQLGMYFMTVCVGLLAHSFIVLPICYLVLTRKNPFTFMLGTVKALVTGFATASSSATLPVTIECCEKNNGIDPRITRFVLPIGATINMHGTALYEAVAALFIAQVNDTPLDFGKIMAVSITATAAAIGAAGIPQAGLVTMVMVLDAVGLPADKVGTILAIDWLLDRIRTAVNILGDIMGTGVVSHLCQNFLKKIDAAELRSKENLAYSETEIELREEMVVVGQNYHLGKFPNPNGESSKF